MVILEVREMSRLRIAGDVAEASGVVKEGEEAILAERVVQGYVGSVAR